MHRVPSGVLIRRQAASVYADVALNDDVITPRPDGSVYLCGIGGSDHVEGARLRQAGDCGTADKIEANSSRVSAAHKSLTAMAPALTAGVDGPSKTQACMRPCPPDAMPMMGPVPGHDNIFLSAGHNCWGILWGRSKPPLSNQECARGH